MTPQHDRPSLDRRASLLALMLGLPAIITACGVTAIETWRSVRPSSPLFAASAAASFADAIAGDDVYGAYEFIRAGQNPNDAIAVRHPVLTGGRQVEVLPLLWAVATQSEGAVAMLMGFGARLDPATTRSAVCLADQLDRADIVQLLQLSERDASPEPCPIRRRDDMALLLTTP